MNLMSMRLLKDQDFIIDLIIFIILSIIAAPILYPRLVIRPQQTKIVFKEGICIKAKIDRTPQGTGFGINDVLCVYNFFVESKKYDDIVLSSKTPSGYGLPDTVDVFYLKENPSINRPAFEIYPDYRYNWTDENQHKPRPDFDSQTRKYIQR